MFLYVKIYVGYHKAHPFASNNDINNNNHNDNDNNNNNNNNNNGYITNIL